MVSDKSDKSDMSDESDESDRSDKKRDAKFRVPKKSDYGIYFTSTFLLLVEPSL